MAKSKPFHESIVKAVSIIKNDFQGYWDSTNGQMQLELLAKLTTATIIPKNHDNIAAAFRKADKRFNGEEVRDDDVRESVMLALRHIQKEKQRHAKKK